MCVSGDQSCTFNPSFASLRADGVRPLWHMYHLQSTHGSCRFICAFYIYITISTAYVYKLHLHTSDLFSFTLLISMYATRFDLCLGHLQACKYKNCLKEDVIKSKQPPPPFLQSLFFVILKTGVKNMRYIRHKHFLKMYIYCSENCTVL